MALPQAQPAAGGAGGVVRATVAPGGPHPSQAGWQPCWPCPSRSNSLLFPSPLAASTHHVPTSPHTHWSRPIAGPPDTTSETITAVSPVILLGRSRPPETAKPKPR